MVSIIKRILPDVVLPFGDKLIKARYYWCKCRYRALKREDNRDLLNELNQIEDVVRDFEGSEIKKRWSRRGFKDIKSKLLNIKEKINHSKKTNILTNIVLHRVREQRRNWCRLRLKVLEHNSDKQRDDLLEELNGIETDLQTVEERGDILTRSDKNRKMNAVKNSLSEFEIKISKKIESIELIKTEGKPRIKNPDKKSALPKGESSIAPNKNIIPPKKGEALKKENLGKRSEISKKDITREKKSFFGSILGKLKKAEKTENPTSKQSFDEKAIIEIEKKLKKERGNKKN